MFGDLALVEDDVLARIDAGRDECGRHFADIALQLGRRLRHGDRVQVDDAIDAVVGFLQRDEFGDRAQIVPEVQIACRLHTGEDAFLEFGHDSNPAARSGAPYRNAGASRQGPGLAAP